MVRFLLLIFLVFTGEGVGDLPVYTINLSKVYVVEKPHHFSRVYEQIRQNEGNYVNHPQDRGRETYAGISRRMFPQWQGWYEIDEAKPLQRFDSVASAEYYVKDWYLSKWVDGGFEKIEDFDVALNLFDFSIHSSPRTVELKVNRVLAIYGCDPIKVEGEWVPDSINTLPATEFILRLKIERLKLFNYLVRKDPSQIVFLRGWYKRIEQI